MRWFKGPKGASVFHGANAFDDGDKVHVDLCVTDTNAFPFIRAAGEARLPARLDRIA